MSYVDEVLARVKAKNASEPEFLLHHSDKKL